MQAIMLDLVSGRIAYGSLFGLRAVGLYSFIQPSGWLPLIQYQMSGRIVYAPKFGLQAVSLYFYIMPLGG